jgi:imidazolonepropionase-like amidohydrolase
MHNKRADSGCRETMRRNAHKYMMLSTALRLALLLPAVAAPVAAQAPTPLAVVGVDVLTMADGAQLRRNLTVLIEGEHIRALGPDVVIPPNATRIDGRGLVLLPGLMDMHVHLDRDPASWMGVFLAHGVTTVLNLHGGPAHLELRERIRRLELLAPRVYTSGPFVNRPGIETEPDAARAAREHKAAGYDVIKIHGPLSNLAFRTLLDSAHALRIPVVGHAPRNLAFDSVLALRMDMVAHAEELIYTKFRPMNAAALGDLPARMAAARVWLVPTLSTFHGIVGQWGRPAAADSALRLAEATFFSPALRRYWSESNPYTGRPADGAAWAQRAYNFQLPLVRALHQAGVRLMTGTDTPVPVMVPGASLHLELAELRAAGLSAFDALAAATRNPGDFIQQLIDPQERVGRVQPGYVADLLLVRGDPLTDLAVLRAPQAVITRGRYLDAARLNALRTSGQ